MIEINLLPEEFRKKEAVKLQMPEIPVFKILPPVLIAVAAIQILAGAFAFFKQIEIASLKHNVESLTQETAAVAENKKNLAALKVQHGKMLSIAQGPFYWSSLLNALSHSVTKGIWLRGLSLTKSDAGQYMRLEGSVMGPGQETAYVGKFIKELKDNPLIGGVFSNIELADMSGSKIKEREVYNFTLMCAFRKEKSDTVDKKDKAA